MTEFKTLTRNGCKNTALNTGDCVSLDSDDPVNVVPISFNWGRKRTIENDMHLGSDHPQCQYIQVDLAIMF